MGPEGEAFPDGGAASAAVCRAPRWAGALEEAKELHDEYVAALEEFVEFQEANDDKILLWNTIRDLLVNSESKERVDAEDLFKQLGLDTPSDPDVVRVIEDRLNIEPAVTLLANGAELERVLYALNPLIFARVPFVRFGVRYLYRQAAVTIRAYQLIEYLKTGVKDTTISSMEEAFELRPADLSHENAFYMEFKASPYDEQIRIANRLLTDLDKSDVGREFLADLFEHRRDAIFDPLGFVPPLPVAWSDRGYHSILAGVEGFEAMGPVECLEDGTVSVIVKNSDELQRYYTGNYRLRLSESNFAAESLGIHLLELISKLQPGLGYFVATRTRDEAYMNGVEAGDDEHPVEVYREFSIGVVSLFTNDDHMREVIEAIDWGDRDKPDWPENAFRNFRTRGELSEEAVVKFFQVATAGGETFLDMHKIPGANFATTLKGTLSVLVSFKVLIDLHELGQMSDTQRLNAIFDVVGGINDVASVATLRAQRLGQLFRFLGVALNGLSAVLSFVEMSEAFDRGDDAWIGHGMAGVGFTIFYGVGLYKTVAITKVGLLGSFAIGSLLLVGVALIVIGLIVSALLTDGPFERWLKNTYFGVEWETLRSNPRKFADPGKDPDSIPDTYGYSEFVLFGHKEDRFVLPPENDARQVPGPQVNYVRQVSGLFSTIRPVEITGVKFDREERDGEDRWRGHILVEPGHTQLLADGDLYLRPVKIYRAPSVSHPDLEYADVVTDTCLHRFSLADERGDEELQSRTNLEAAVSDLKKRLEELDLNWALAAIEEHREGKFTSGDVDLEIVDVDREENEDEEMAITKWEAKVWDMSGHSADRIFGFPQEKLAEDMNRFYVELIYVPPRLAQAIESDGSLWFRPEKLPSVSREIVPIIPPGRISP